MAGLPLRSARSAALPAIVALAAALRGYPWITAHSFRGVLEYDDGVYYAAARSLAHGLVPYRDFTIVHPPLTTILLLPFAVLGNWLGDPAGMAAARVAILVVAIANIVLIHRLVRRWCEDGSWAPVVAAAAYALFPGAVAAEHTVLLEPMMNCAALAAGLLLFGRDEPSTRRLVAGGVLLAAAIDIKAFAAVYLAAAVVVVLLDRTRRRQLLPLAGGVVGAFAVFTGPFVIAAPHRFWVDVVVTQLHRPADGGTSTLHRLRDMLGAGSVPLAVGVLTAVVIVAFAAVAVWRRRETHPLFWLLAAVLMAGGFLASPSYFSHYGGALAVPLAVLVGLGVERRPDRRASVLLLLPATVFAISAITPLTRWHGQGDFGAAGRLVRTDACVYTDAVSLAIAANVFQPPSAHCPGWLDGRGVNLTENRDWPPGKPFYPQGFQNNVAWQRETMRQLGAARYALIRGRAQQVAEWSAETRSYFLGNFRLIWQTGGRVPAQLWIRE